MRIGLFGGTFNPIHLGHLKAAKRVKAHFAIDTVVFIPSALPPHKDPINICKPKDRLEMVRLAIAGYQGLSLSDSELKRAGYSYTIDTVCSLKNEYDDDDQLFLLMGLDAFLEIQTWKSYADLFRLIASIVMLRPGVGGADFNQMQTLVDQYLTSIISPRYRYSVEKKCFTHAKLQPVSLYDVAPLDISATAVREQLKRRQSIASLVPPQVAEYIQRKGLYQ